MDNTSNSAWTTGFVRTSPPGTCPGCGRCNTCGRSDTPIYTQPQWTYNSTKDTLLSSGIDKFMQQYPSHSVQENSNG